MNDERRPEEEADSPEEEGIPEHGGPAPGKRETGDQQEGLLPPGDEPRGAEGFGTTAREQRERESLDQKLAEEASDVEPGKRPGSGRLVEPGSGVSDEEENEVAEEADDDRSGLSAEEAAMRDEEEPGGLTGGPDRYVEEERSPKERSDAHVRLRDRSGDVHMPERGSDKSGPRIDEERERETEAIERGAPVPSRSEEFREVEGAGDDEPTPDARLSGDRGMVPEDQLGPDELEARSDIARHLDPSIFPADWQAVLQSARDNNAPAGVLAELARLPRGTTFDNVQAVWEALGGPPEERT
jgi:hypothetical protein